MDALSPWIANALQFVAMIVAGVWFVAKLTTTGEKLAEAIDRLDGTMEKIDDKVDNHAERIARLEARE